MTTKYILDEMRVIKIGRIIRGFRTYAECTNRLRDAGYPTFTADVSAAVWRETVRQRLTGERPYIVTRSTPHGWVASCQFDNAGPVGCGDTEPAAVFNLTEQLNARAAA